MVKYYCQKCVKDLELDKSEMVASGNCDGCGNFKLCDQYLDSEINIEKKDAE